MSHHWLSHSSHDFRVRHVSSCVSFGHGSAATFFDSFSSSSHNGPTDTIPAFHHELSLESTDVDAAAKSVGHFVSIADRFKLHLYRGNVTTHYYTLVMIVGLESLKQYYVQVFHWDIVYLLSASSRRTLWRRKRLGSKELVYRGWISWRGRKKYSEYSNLT